MASGTRNIRMLLSQDCFDLLADAMCVFSKNSAKFQSLRSTVQHACKQSRSVEFDRKYINQFVAEHPVDGKVAVWLEVKPDWIDDYDEMRRNIARISGKTLHDKVVIPFVVHLAQVNHLF